MRKRLVAALIALTMIFTFGVSNVSAQENENVSSDKAGEISDETREYISENAGVGDTSEEYIVTEADENATEVNETRSILKGASVASSLSSYSSLDYGYIGDSRSQGEYETCWAFAAAGIMESSLASHGYASASQLDLSELQLAYFTYHQANDPLGNSSDDYATVNGTLWSALGGNVDWALNIILAGKGIAQESSSSALSYDNIGSTYSLDESYAYDYNYATAKNVYYLNLQANPSLVKQAIIDYGSVAVAYYATTNTRTLRRYYNSKTNGYYYTGMGTANHAVTIVGWDDDYSASNFNTKPAGDGAWLVRNSWANNTEDRYYSYFWLSYYDSSLETRAYVVDAEPISECGYDNIYQYDGGIYSTPSGVVKGANVFTVSASNYEEITSVLVSASEDTNLGYTVQIYTNLKDESDPTSGTLRCTQTGTFNYGGIHTVDLDTPIVVKKGMKYSVVVTLGSNDAKGIDVERSGYIAGSSFGTSISVYADCDDGQSFAYKYNSWNDLSGVSSTSGNLRIKAYTRNMSAAEVKELTVEKVTSVSLSAASSASIKVSWPSDEYADGYYLAYKKQTDNEYTIKTISTTNSDECIFTLSGLSPGTVYDIKVCAFSGSKTGEYSEVASMTTLPGKVSATQATSDKSSVTLKWTKQTGASGYIIYRSATKNGTYKKISVIKSGSTVKYKNTKLKSGKKYYYKVVTYKRYNDTTYYGSGAKCVAKTK